MIRKSRFVLVLSLAAAAALAGNLSIVSSFPSWKPWCRGLEYAGGYLYEMSNFSYHKIIVYNTSGSVVRLIPTPPVSTGLEVSGAGGYIWVNTWSSSRVYTLRMDGSIVSSFPGPAYGNGLTHDGTYFYYSSLSAKMVYVLTGNGSVVRSFSEPGTEVGGLDFDGTNLWIADWPGPNGGLYYCNTMGSILDSFVPTPGAARPSGVCWDGTYVWYHDFFSPYYVYKAQVTFSSIAPASLGRVKALFR